MAQFLQVTAVTLICLLAVPFSPHGVIPFEEGVIVEGGLLLDGHIVWNTPATVGLKHAGKIYRIPATEVCSVNTPSQHTAPAGPVSVEKIDGVVNQRIVTPGGYIVSFSPQEYLFFLKGLSPLAAELARDNLFLHHRLASDRTGSTVLHDINIPALLQAGHASPSVRPDPAVADIQYRIQELNRALVELKMERFQGDKAIMNTLVSRDARYLSAIDAEWSDMKQRLDNEMVYRKKLASRFTSELATLKDIFWSDLASSQHKLRELSTSIESLQEENQEYVKTLIALQNDIKETKHYFSELCGAIEKDQTERSVQLSLEMKEQLVLLNATVDDVHSTFSNLAARHKTHLEELASKTDDTLEQIGTDLSSLQQAIASLTHESKALKQSLVDEDTSIRGSIEELALGVSETVKTIRASIEDMEKNGDETAEKLGKEIQGVTADLQGMVGSLHELNEALSHIKTTTSATSEEVAGLLTRTSASDEQLKQLQADHLAGLQRFKEEYHLQEQKLVTLIDEMNTGLKKDMGTFYRDIEDLLTENLILKDNYAKLSEKLAEISKKIAVDFKETAKLVVYPIEHYFKMRSSIPPDDYEAHYRLGLFCLKNGLYHEALREFEGVRKINPAYQHDKITAKTDKAKENIAANLYEKGLWWWNNTEDYETAQDYMLRIVEEYASTEVASKAKNVLANIQVKHKADTRDDQQAQQENWSSIDTFNFQVLYTNNTNNGRDNFSIALEMAACVEDLRKIISRHLAIENLGAWNNKCQIFVYDTKDEYILNSLAPEWSVGWHEQRHSIAKGGIRSTVEVIERTIITYKNAPDLMDTIIPHEIAHILFREQAGFLENVPLWLDEGVAVIEESKRRKNDLSLIKRKVSLNEHIPFSMLFTLQEYPADQRLFYAQSASMVDFLKHEYGMYRFKSFLESLRDGGDSLSALQEIYPAIHSVREFEAAWTEYVKRRY